MYEISFVISKTKRFLLCIVTLSIFLLFLSCFTVLMLFLSIETSNLGLKERSDPNISHPSALSSAPLFLTTERRRTLAIQDGRSGSPYEHGEAKEQVVSQGCELNQAALKVYMYDLPPEFHFGLLGWKGKGDHKWPDVSKVEDIPTYPGGLNLQHSIEYWLTLDLLSSNTPGVSRPCTAIRVANASFADVFFVPFFSSLSYNRHSQPQGAEKVSRNKLLQNQLVKYLMSQEHWKRGGGKDHIIVAHHPNSLLQARKKLGSAMFVLADFGRYPPQIANLKKDIIAPYRHVVQSISNNSAVFGDRTVLAYFQGAINRKDGGKIRQKLYQLLKGKKDVHFSYGSIRENGIRRSSRGMTSSKFCLNIAGDTPSSNRLFDAIVSHCVPVIISDDIELPFEDVLDYSEFCIFVRAADAVKKGLLLHLLRGIKQDEWTKLWERLKQIAHHFEYQYPSKQGDSVQMIWEVFSRKIPSIRLKLNKDKRFYRSDVTKQSRKKAQTSAHQSNI